MTDQMLEQRLRAFYRAEVDDGVTAAPSLRDAVAGIADVPVRPAFFGGRAFTLLAAAVLGVLLIGTAVIVGSFLLKLAPAPLPTGMPVVPQGPLHTFVPATPSPTGPQQTPLTPSPQATASAEPTPTPEPTPVALIAVYHGLGNTAQVLTLNPVTGEQTVLGTVDVDGVQLRSGVYGAIVWSTDRRLVTVSRVGDAAQVQAQLDVETRAITPASVGFESYVSPLGDRIAGLDGDPYGVTIADLAGNVVTQVPLPPSGTYYSRVTWTPDGSAVLVAGMNPSAPAARQQLPSNVIANTLSGPGELLVVPLDGGPTRTVATDADRNFGPGDMSVDMSTIVTSAFCVATCSEGPGIVSIDVATGAFTQLTSNALDQDPTWSPDGARIAFIRNSAAGRGIWVMNADGSNLTRLTTPTRPDRDHDFAWSPDGSSILFSRGDTSKTGLGDLYIVSSTGGNPQLLLTNAVGDW